MTNQMRILGILLYKFVTNEKVASLSQLPSLNEAYGLGCSWSQSRHDRAQDSLAPGEDNQVVRENAEWSRSPTRTRTQGSLLL